jgi:hypothetical protein
MNPYAAPSDTNPGSEPSGSYCRDALVILLAVASFWLLGGVGAGLSKYFVTPQFVMVDALDAVYWVRWGCGVSGRFTGDFVCGILLGRCLTRISPWLAFALISTFPILVLVFNGFFLNADNGAYLAHVGPIGVTVQLTVKVAAMLAIVAFGIWLGSRWKRQVNAW